MSCADRKQCNNALLPLIKFLFENEALETKWSNLTGFGVTTVLASSITGNYIKKVFSKFYPYERLAQFKTSHGLER